MDNGENKVDTRQFHELAMDYRGASVVLAPVAYNALVNYVQQLVDSALASQPAAPVQPVPVMQEDLLDIVRTLVCAVDRQAERGENYPSPTSENSPIMLAARRACVERGYTDGGLAVEGITYPAAPPVQQPGDVRAKRMPEPASTKAVPLLYTDAVNDEQVCRDDLWIVTTHVVNRAACADLATTRPSAALTDEQKVELTAAIDTIDGVAKFIHGSVNMVQTGEYECSHASEFDSNLDQASSELTMAALAIRELLAASSGAVAVPEGWQPIETAPKDGTMILLGRAEDEENDRGAISTVGRWHDEDHDGPDNMGHDAGFMDDEYQQFAWGRSFGNSAYMSGGFQPTYWMPLPAAPATPAQGQTK